MRALIALVGLFASTAAAQTEPPAAPAEPGQPPAETTPAEPTPDETSPDTPSVAESPGEQPPSDAAAEPAEEVIPPELVTFVEAGYPQRARDQGVEASVVLAIDIDAEGQVEGVSVLVPAEPAGYGFDEAATVAAFQFVFAPARVGETPVPVRIEYRYNFVLADEPEAEEPEPVPEPVVNLMGQLLERGTRNPLAGVIVTVARGEGDAALGFETTADADGRFEFYDLEPGEWRVLADPEGYYPLDITETVIEGERTEVRVFVERISYNPFDVLVRAPRPRKEVNRTSIEVAEADKVPGTFGDVLAVVQNLPGVARAQFGTGAIIIRGSAPDDSQIYVDGVDVPLIYHFGGLRSVIPVGMLERIDFYPGNFSAYYGRATGGIVDVGIKSLKPEKLGGYVDVNLFDAGAYIETPIGDKGAIAIAARRSYVDFVLDLAVPDDANVSLVAAPRFYDYQLLGTYRPAPGHELRGFFFGSDDQTRLLFSNPGDTDVRLGSGDLGASTRFYRTLFDYKYVPNDDFDNTFKIAAGRNWIDFSAGDAFIFDLNFYVAQIRDTVRWRPLEGLTLRAGVDYLFTKADADFKLPFAPKEGERRDRPDLSTVLVAQVRDQAYQSIGSFLELELELWERWLLVPGLRLDYFTRTGELAAAPRFGTRLKISDMVTAKGGIGLFIQEPSFDETADVFGNPDLGTESAIHYSAGAEVKPLEYLTIDATLFYKDLRNLVSRTDGVVERGGELVPQRYDNDGAGRVYGLELLVRHELANNLFGWLSYTLSRGERRDSGDSDYRLFDYDQTHIFAAVASYRLPANWEIGARWRFVSGQLDTPVAGAVFDADADVYEPISGPSNSRRVGAFHQLDLRVDKRWVFDNWMLTAYVDVQNVYNRTNEQDLEYNFNYTEEEASGGLPIFAIIGLRGEF